MHYDLYTGTILSFPTSILCGMVGPDDKKNGLGTMIVIMFVAPLSSDLRIIGDFDCIVILLYYYIIL